MLPIERLPAPESEDVAAAARVLLSGSPQEVLALLLSARRVVLPPMEAQRSLLTLLFTDIVGSTDLVERLGDEAWRALLVRHHEIVRTQLAIFRGHEIDHAGDGFFVTFDRPGQAVRFAQAVRDALGAIGIAVRCGIHAGECEQIDGQVLGVAVHVAARVAGMARPGEILVSGTVKDLLAGSGFEFGNRGWHTLKGLRERRQLHSLGSPAAMPAVERPRVGARRAFALVR